MTTRRTPACRVVPPARRSRRRSPRTPRARRRPASRSSSMRATARPTACPSGTLQFKFWNDANASGAIEPAFDLVLRDWTDNPIYSDAPLAQTSPSTLVRYAVQVRCSTNLACGSPAAFANVTVNCPSTGTSDAARTVHRADRVLRQDHDHLQQPEVRRHPRRSHHAAVERRSIQGHGESVFGRFTDGNVGDRRDGSVGGRRVLLPHAQR